MAEARRFEKKPYLWKIIFTTFFFIGILVAINQVFDLRLLGFSLLETSYFYLILSLFLSVTFLLFPASESAPTDKLPWYDAILFLTTAVTGLYFCLHGFDIIQLGWEYTAPLTPTIFSILLWVLVLEAVRRTTDIYMVLTCSIISLYPLIAIHMPSVFQGQSYDILTTARLYAMGRGGIIGIPLDVVCTLLIGFMVFGIIFQSTGGGTFFFKVAECLIGHTRRGKDQHISELFFWDDKREYDLQYSCDRINDHTRNEKDGVSCTLCRCH